MTDLDTPPPCPDHREVQHRDGKPPWCPRCGWNHGRPATPPRQVKMPATVPATIPTPAGVCCEHCDGGVANFGAKVRHDHDDPCHLCAVDAEAVEQCGPECSEMHRYTVSCVLRPAAGEAPPAECPGCGGSISALYREHGVCRDCFGTDDDPAAGEAPPTEAAHEYQGPTWDGNGDVDICGYLPATKPSCSHPGRPSPGSSNTPKRSSPPETPKRK